MNACQTLYMSNAGDYPYTTQKSCQKLLCNNIDSVYFLHLLNLKNYMYFPMKIPCTYDIFERDFY